MTKAEIFKMIEKQNNTQGEVCDKLGKLIHSPNVGMDATAIAALLTTINATIFDTMSTLALILCEMLPDEAPKKGDHDRSCLGCNCLCNTCVRDNSHSSERACCDQHGFEKCSVTECPDYVKEG